jgi:MoxR-like ATPase
MVAFLDEIFKCNSAVLNSLLSILNERLFFNDGQPTTIPLQFAVGASNELPDDREELGALWDRFLLRYVVGYIRDTKNFEKLLAPRPVQTTHISVGELEAAQNEVKLVAIDKIVPYVIQLRKKMQSLNIPVSDRRWKQCLSLVQANAWLEGRAVATSEDLEILSDSLWQDPSQIAQVRQEIMALANPLDQEALDLYDQAMEIYQNAMTASDEKATSVGTEGNAKLKKITKKLQDLQTEAKNKNKNDSRISEVLTQVVDWNREVIQKCLGITV